MKKIDLSMPDLSLPHVVRIGLLGLLILIAYYSALVYLWGLWKGEDYSYCYLIPLVTLYLIWEKRHLLAQASSAPTWAGLPLVIVALCLFFVGELGGEYYSIHVSLWLLIIGLCWLLLGWKKLKILAFPLGILLTAIPFPYFIYANLSLRLKLISSQLGVWMLHRAGFSAYREGNVIDLGFTQLQVVDACSGLRFLIPLFVLAVIMVYFYRASIWKKLVVVLSTIPLTVFTNSLRIAMTGIIYKHFGAKAAEGFFHGFSGWLIFMFTLGVLLAEIWVLRHILPRPSESFFARSEPAESVGSASSPQGGRSGFSTFLSPPQFAVATALLALTLGLSMGIEFREKTPVMRPLSQFPLTVGTWEGSRQYLEKKFITELDLSDYVIADYRKNDGRSVNFYVAWYESQRKGESIHSPETCLPGSGWVFREAGQVQVPLTGAARIIKVNRAIMEKSGQKQISYFWFPARGRILTNVWEMKLYTFWDALTRQRTDGALVRLITPVMPDETAEQAEERLQQFTREVVAMLDQYLPK